MSASDNALDFVRGLRILLVEDDPLIRLDLESSLSELGATVTAASDVRKALTALEALKLDFAVLDFELGAETSEPIAEAARARNIPFLYLSGYGEHDERFGRWPGIRVLAKPLSAAGVTNGIQDVMEDRH